MKILIVDDNPDDRILLKTILGKAGYGDLAFAASAAEACAVLGLAGTPETEAVGADDAIGLVLLDVIMPDVDGIEVCRRIKSDERFCDVPVIMVTGRSDTEVLRAAFAAGAADYIVKPYNRFELLARVGAAASLATTTRDLRRSEKRLRDITATLGEGVYVLDAAGRVTFANPEAERLLGWREAELLGRRIHDLVHQPGEETAEPPPEPAALLVHGGAYRREDGLFARKDGSRFPVAYVMSPLVEAGRVLGSVTAFQDITERTQAEARLRLAAKVMEFSPEGIIVTDDDARHGILGVNPAFTAITGYTAEEALGKSPWLLQSWHHSPIFYKHLLAELHARGEWQGEVWNRRKDGSGYPAWLHITAIRDGQGRISQYLAMFSDITLRKEAERRLEFMATHDHLTGLPNRTLLADRLKHAIARAKRQRRRAAVLFIDLDRFKTVNDSLGHPAGDLLLVQVAERLLQCIREQDTVARLGGDEFTLIVEGLTHPEGATVVAQKVLAALDASFEIEGHEVFVGASIGISVYPDDGTEVTHLLKTADTAMYRAKEAGRKNYQFYTAAATSTPFERLALESSLRRALARQEFLLYYQPQVSLGTGRIVGAEALLRWRHSELGVVPCGQFIPIAEETGLIREIGEWVLWSACAQMGAWRRVGLAAPRVAVNISPSQFVGRRLTDSVAAALAAARLGKDCLELEITEGLLMKNVEEIIAIMRKLKDMGVHLAIDDFGTGYSSLSYLKRFPIDRLKIDMSFVHGIHQDPDSGAIAGAIVALGHSLQLTVIAEGVETEAQRDVLRDYGCDEAQGYLHGRPMPPEAFAELLDGKAAGAQRGSAGP